MLDRWRKIWQETVENFRRELHGGEGPDAPALGAPAAMRRELAAARSALGDLEAELRRVRDEFERERREEGVCGRRKALALGIGDHETARIAGEFQARHAERASVLARKLEVLDAERALALRDIARMEERLEILRPPPPGPEDSAGRAGTELEDNAGEFRELERRERERAAEARLQEIKRRMR